MTSINKFKIAIIIFVLIFFYWLYFESTKNIESLDKIALSMIIHSSALYVSLSYFKHLKIPFVFVFCMLNIIGFVISPANVDFKIFQLGDFNPEIIDDINLGFIVFYTSHFLFLSYQISHNYQRNPMVLTYQESYHDKKDEGIKQLQLLQNYTILFYLFSKILELPISGLNEFIELLTIGSLLIGFFKGINSVFKNILTVLILSVSVIQILVSGLIYPLIFFGIFILAIIFLYGLSSFISKVITIAGFLFILGFSVLFNPVKMDYRQIDFSGKSVFYRVQVIQELIVDNKQSENIESEEEKNTFWRLTYPMSAISMAQEKTPTKVPYWEGESYLNLIYKFIPRIIWRDKPKEEMGQLFGHRYEILDKWNFTTSMNTPLITEGYINFGFFGFFGIFILMSYLMARVFITSNLKYTKQLSSLQTLLSGLNVAIVLVFVIQWESNFSMVFGKIIILFIVNKLIELLAFRKQVVYEDMLHINLKK